MSVRLDRKILLALLLLPSAATSLALPDLLGWPVPQTAMLLWRAALAMPVILLPIVLALTRLERHQRRAAYGLGAGWLDRLRWIWLPQLGPGLLLSLLLAILFLFGHHFAAHFLH